MPASLAARGRRGRPPPRGTAETAAGRGRLGRPRCFARRLLGRAHCSPHAERWPAGRGDPGPPPAAAPGGPAARRLPTPRRAAPPPLGLTAKSHRPDCIINVNGAASMSCAGSLGLLLCDTYTGILTRESSITTGVENQPVRDSFQMPRKAERLQDCFIKVTENKNY